MLVLLLRLLLKQTMKTMKTMMTMMTPLLQFGHRDFRPVFDFRDGATLSSTVLQTLSRQRFDPLANKAQRTF
jgi:hypothetical protein